VTLPSIWALPWPYLSSPVMSARTSRRPSDGMPAALLRRGGRGGRAGAVCCPTLICLAEAKACK
jgi:hypothetical protein